MAKVTKLEITTELETILRRNAPVREYPTCKINGREPGNLKTKGIKVVEDTPARCHIVIGGDEAPYAIYTETRSHKKGWQKKSASQFLRRLERLGGKRK